MKAGETTVPADPATGTGETGTGGTTTPAAGETGTTPAAGAGTTTPAAGETTTPPTAVEEEYSLPQGWLESFALDSRANWSNGYTPPSVVGDGSMSNSEHPNKIVPATPWVLPDDYYVKLGEDPLPDSITNVEQFMLGFVTGSGGSTFALPQSSICVNSIKCIITGSFKLIRLNHATELFELAAKYQSLQQCYNLAYAHCSFGQYLAGYASVFGDYGIEDALRLQEEENLGEPVATNSTTFESATPVV